jgi:hypothetical protein
LRRLGIVGSFSWWQRHIFYFVTTGLDPVVHADVQQKERAYPRDSSYVEAVSNFISKAQNDPSWRGNGLEFDRLKPK